MRSNNNMLNIHFYEKFGKLFKRKFISKINDENYRRYKFDNNGYYIKRANIYY